MHLGERTRAPTASFVVRIWSTESDGEIRGEIENVRTGERQRFRRYESLVRVLQGWRHDAMSVSPAD